MPLDQTWAETILIGYDAPELVLERPTQVQCASFLEGHLHPLIHEGAEFHLWDGHPIGRLKVLEIVDKDYSLEYSALKSQV